MKVSACWIAKNESAVLARSIQSLQHVVDELVVIDTGSTDNTVEIAQSLGARVEHFEWVKDFAKARNFAIAQTTGDIIIFLDADEWFFPALENADREEILSYFLRLPALNCLAVPLTNIDTKTQMVQDKMSVIRILRKDPHLYYTGAIHELLVDDRSASLFSLETSFNINHSGYSQDVMARKMERNIDLLEKELEDPKLSEEERIKTKAYLMREYRLGGQFEKEFEAMQWLLANPRTLRTLAGYPILATTYCFTCITSGVANRYRVSRRQLYNNVVTKMPKEMPRDPSSALIKLNYDLAFDLQEDRFIQEVALEAPFGRWDNVLIVDNNFWKRMAVLYIEVAKAYWRRDNRPKTLEYLSRGFMIADDYLNTDGLHILLICMRGQPEADQIILLDTLFKTANKAKMAWLVEVLREEKSPTLYLYFFKKQVENGWALKADYYYVKLLLNQQEELLEVLEESLENSADETAIDILSMVIVCSGNSSLLEKYKEKLAPHLAMLQAFLKGEVLEEPTYNERLKMLIYYPVFAIIDEAAAEGFRAVFANSIFDSCNARLRFCVNNERYQDGLKIEFGSIENSISTVNFYLYCALRSGEYDLLLRCALKAIELGTLDAETLATILAGAEKAQGETKAALRQLYDTISGPYWEHVDMLDMVRTGYLEEVQFKKELKALGTLSFPQFEKELEQEGERFSIALFNQTLLAAGELFEQRKLWLKAYFCYRSLLQAKAEEQNAWQGLGRVFEKMNNGPMAKICGEQARKALEQAK